MKRTFSTLTALVAASALVLSGCAKETAGTVSGGGAAPTAQPPGSLGENTGSPSIGGDTGGQTTGGDDTGGQTTGGDDTGGQTTGGDDTSTETTGGGGGTGSANAQDVTWFDTFCGSIAPLVDLQDITGEMDASDPVGSMKKIGPKISAAGATITAGVEKLKTLPALTFEGGDKFTSTVVSSFGELGPKLKEIGDKLTNLDPSNPSSASGLAELSTTMQDAVKPLQELGDLPAAGQAAMAAAPACKSLMGS